MIDCGPAATHALWVLRCLRQLLRVLKRPSPPPATAGGASASAARGQASAEHWAEVLRPLVAWLPTVPLSGALQSEALALLVALLGVCSAAPQGMERLLDATALKTPSKAGLAAAAAVLTVTTDLHVATRAPFVKWALSPLTAGRTGEPRIRTMNNTPSLGIDVRAPRSHSRDLFAVSEWPSV